ncbi:hypothetical protein CSKR_112754 [Clonorchis sinensis]|uniref:Uncharacterized protein n=1 Tax=Clonorchis sinensis TaxID=79923 RepID=A0A3R7CDF9_CLOSI|nr:hypothetical protein CSKR_112754 [Clonorchis sinensis]
MKNAAANGTESTYWAAASGPQTAIVVPIHSSAYQFGFHRRLIWKPAKSLLYDVLLQLIVLHQAASGFIWYDIRDIATDCSDVRSQLVDDPAASELREKRIRVRMDRQPEDV